MKRIAVEEHFYTAELTAHLHTRKTYPRQETVEGGQGRKMERIWYAPTCWREMPVPDPFIVMGKERIRDLDNNGIQMEVISLQTPGVESFEVEEGITWAKKTNDSLAKAVHEHPDRFAGLAALPVQDPGAAAAELQRAVKVLGLRGAKINSHVNGEFLDDKKYWPIFEMAQALDVPLYLHPKEPSPGLLEAFKGVDGLEGPMFGFATEVSLHAMRLICNGVFDVFPRLKIVVGHMGEGLPFHLYRMDDMYVRTPIAQKIRRKPSDYIKDNFYIATSGMFSQPALMCTYLALGADRILFAADYPCTRNDWAVQFMDAAPICDADKEKIYHLNAERLLKL